MCAHGTCARTSTLWPARQAPGRWAGDYQDWGSSLPVPLCCAQGRHRPTQRGAAACPASPCQPLEGHLTPHSPSRTLLSAWWVMPVDWLLGTVPPSPDVFAEFYLQPWLACAAGSQGRLSKEHLMPKHPRSLARATAPRPPPRTGGLDRATPIPLLPRTLPEGGHVGESPTGGRAFGFLSMPHLVTSGRETSTIYMGSWVLREEKLEMKDAFVLLGTTRRFRQTWVVCSRTGEQGWTTLQSSA